MSDQREWRLDTGYAVGLVVTVGQTVTDGAPIFRWMRGRNWVEVQDLLRQRGQLQGLEELHV